MADLPYMPLATDAILADAGDLPNYLFGAYMRLLIRWWRDGAAPELNEKRLARWAGAPPDEFDQLKEFLTLTNEGWIQKRLAETYAEQMQKHRDAQKAIHIRWHKAGKHNDQPNVDCPLCAENDGVDTHEVTTKEDRNTSVYTDVLPTMNHEPYSELSIDNSSTARARATPPLPDRPTKPRDADDPRGTLPPEPDKPAPAKSKRVTESDLIDAFRGVLDREDAKAVIDHRRALKKPLTVRAGVLLSGKLSRCRDGPKAAAECMIENGWQGFEAEWYDARKRTNGALGAHPAGGEASRILGPAERVINRYARPDYGGAEPLRRDGEPGDFAESPFDGITLDGASTPGGDRQSAVAQAGDDIGDPDERGGAGDDVLRLYRKLAAVSGRSRPGGHS